MSDDMSMEVSFHWRQIMDDILIPGISLIEVEV
jgi:hypothetical protein